MGFSLPSAIPFNAPGRGWRSLDQGKGLRRGAAGGMPEDKGKLEPAHERQTGLQGTVGTSYTKVVPGEREEKSAGQHVNKGAGLLEEADPRKTTPIYLVQ